jgi:hypothetical protein
MARLATRDVSNGVEKESGDMIDANFLFNLEYNVLEPLFPGERVLEYSLVIDYKAGRWGAEDDYTGVDVTLLVGKEKKQIATGSGDYLHEALSDLKSAIARIPNTIPLP